jgi:hypothetical protein
MPSDREHKGDLDWSIFALVRGVDLVDEIVGRDCRVHVFNCRLEWNDREIRADQGSYRSAVSKTGRIDVDNLLLGL